MKDLDMEFTHLPFGTALIWFLLGLAIGSSLSIYADKFSAESIGIIDVLSLASWASAQFFFFEFIYRLIHQLRYVRTLADRLEGINIFHLDPVYSLTNFAARAGLAILFIVYTNPSFVAVPGKLMDPVFLVLARFASAVAITAFVYPLLQIRSRLEDEKAALSKQNALRLEAGLRRLHDRVASENYKGMADFEKGLSSLLKLYQRISGVHTLPWRPGLLRGFLSAIFLPIAIWLAQRLLQTVLGL